MKQLLIPFVLMLTACSSVTIKDGSQDMLIGTDRVQEGCAVKVDNNFKGNVTYHSKHCDVTISKLD